VERDGVVLLRESTRDIMHLKKPFKGRKGKAITNLKGGGSFHIHHEQEKITH